MNFNLYDESPQRFDRRCLRYCLGKQSTRFSKALVLVIVFAMQFELLIIWESVLVTYIAENVMPPIKPNRIPLKKKKLLCSKFFLFHL